jgi:hypothetical protein
MSRMTNGFLDYEHASWQRRQAESISAGVSCCLTLAQYTSLLDFGLRTFRFTNGLQERIKFVNRGPTDWVFMIIVVHVWKFIWRSYKCSMCEPFVTRQISHEHILVNTCNSCCDVKGDDVVVTSQMNAWKQVFMFPLRYYANCISTTLTVLIALKVYFFYSNSVVSIKQSNRIDPYFYQNRLLTEDFQNCT